MIDRKSQETQAATASTHRNSGPPILIVEDSPVQAELLRRALDNSGYKVLTANNGAEGLAIAKSTRPAVVVSDINMPEMNGYAMCVAIREDPVLEHTPVILLTMLSDPQDVIRGLNAGADAYVTKPYNIPGLISSIESLLAYPPVPPPPVERRKAEVRLAGETHLVDAHSPRILNLLISTYANAVQQNQELAATQRELENLNEHLEDRVFEQTAALREAETRYRSIFNQSRDGIVLIDVETGLVAECNPEFERQSGRSFAQLKELHIWELRPPEMREHARAQFEKTKAAGAGGAANLPFQRPDGTVVPIEFVSSRIHLGDRDYLHSSSRDITERKKAEEALGRANRALRTLSSSNMTLVHARNEHELLNAVCRLIVETGGYRMAWIGFAEQDPEKTVRAVAHYGHEEGFLTEAKICWADIEFGRGPTGTAIRSGIAQVNMNFLTNPVMVPWREAARRRGYQSSIAFPLKSAQGILGALTIYATEPDAFNETEVNLLKELAEDLAFGIETLRLRVERDSIAVKQQHNEVILRQSLEQSIQAIAGTVEARDPYTAGHQRRVADLAVAIAEEMDFPEERIQGIRLAASIHDLGKIQVPAEILSKPGKLSEIEFMLIKAHPEAGYDILKNIEYPWPIANMVRQHHERLDGSGYPLGLKGDEILIESRIIAVADVVEAMASHRPYRAALGIDLALKEIERGSGIIYEPEVVVCCLRVFLERKYSFQY